MLKLLLAIVAWFSTALPVSSWSVEESERVSVHVLGVDDRVGENTWEKSKTSFSCFHYLLFRKWRLYPLHCYATRWQQIRPTVKNMSITESFFQKKVFMNPTYKNIQFHLSESYVFKHLISFLVTLYNKLHVWTNHTFVTVFVNLCLFE